VARAFLAATATSLSTDGRWRPGLGGAGCPTVCGAGLDLEPYGDALVGGVRPAVRGRPTGARSGQDHVLGVGKRQSTTLADSVIPDTRRQAAARSSVRAAAWPGLFTWFHACHKRITAEPDLSSARRDPLPAATTTGGPLGPVPRVGSLARGDLTETGPRAERLRSGRQQPHPSWPDPGVATAQRNRRLPAGPATPCARNWHGAAEGLLTEGGTMIAVPRELASTSGGEDWAETGRAGLVRRQMVLDVLGEVERETLARPVAYVDLWLTDAAEEARSAAGRKPWLELVRRAPGSKEWVFGLVDRAPGRAFRPQSYASSHCGNSSQSPVR